MVRVYYTFLLDFLELFTQRKIQPKTIIWQGTTYNLNDKKTMYYEKDNKDITLLDDMSEFLDIELMMRTHVLYKIDEEEIGGITNV